MTISVEQAWRQLVEVEHVETNRKQTAAEQDEVHHCLITSSPSENQVQGCCVVLGWCFFVRPNEGLIPNVVGAQDPTGLL